MSSSVQNIKTNKTYSALNSANIANINKKIEVLLFKNFTEYEG